MVVLVVIHVGEIRSGLRSVNAEIDLLTYICRTLSTLASINKGQILLWVYIRVGFQYIGAMCHLNRCLKKAEQGSRPIE